MHARKQEVNYVLTWRAALGAALRNGCRVRQGGLGHVLCRRGGVVLDDNHRDLGSLRRSLGQSPEKEWVRSKANQIQDKATKLKNYQYSEESYSSSSSSELNAEKSKSGSRPARGGGGVASLGRLAGAVVAV